MQNIKIKTGFTLAEVLVTLVVVGVISALTIPALITSVQESQYRTAWRKIYSDLDQATKRIMLDNGGTLIGAFPRVGLSWSEGLRDKYASYLIPAKSCADNTSRGNCWSNTFYRLNGTEDAAFAATFIGYVAGTTRTDASGMVLNNGIFMVFKDAGAYVEDCDYGEAVPYEIERRVCGSIYIDVNGFKGPNIDGKDIFMVHVTRNGIKPFGYLAIDTAQKNCIQPPETNWSLNSNFGYACSSRYLMQ